MTFILPIDLADPQERAGREIAEKGASAAGTRSSSFFAPAEIVDLARACGFKDARVISRDEVEQRYFAGRAAGLRPGSSEQMLIATT